MTNRFSGRLELVHERPQIGSIGASGVSGVRPGGGRQKHVHRTFSRLPLLAAPAHLSAEAKLVFELIRQHSPHGLLQVKLTAFCSKPSVNMSFFIDVR